MLNGFRSHAAIRLHNYTVVALHSISFLVVVVVVSVVDVVDIISAAAVGGVVDSSSSSLFDAKTTRDLVVGYLLFSATAGVVVVGLM